MRVELKTAARDAMHEHAEQSFPEECCGAMLGRDRDEKNRLRMSGRGLSHWQREFAGRDIQS